MEKKNYETLELVIRPLADTDIVRTSLTAKDKFNDGWDLEIGDYIQKAE